MCEQAAGRVSLHSVCTVKRNRSMKRRKEKRKGVYQEAALLATFGGVKVPEGWSQSLGLL